MFLDVNFGHKHALKQETTLFNDALTIKIVSATIIAYLSLALHVYCYDDESIATSTAAQIMGDVELCLELFSISRRVLKT